MELNTLLYHACSVDIIEFKVTGIRQYSDHCIYEAKATKNVGASGRVEVLLRLDKKNTIRFIGIKEDFETANGSSLEDFVEGIYYTNKHEAKLDHYNMILLPAYSYYEEQKREYRRAKNRYEELKNTISKIKEDIKLYAKD